MPNFWRFNQTLFNAWSVVQGARGKDSLIFNWFWLQNDYFITTKVNVWNMPNINLLTYTNPKSDWGGLLDRFYKQRNINVEGHIIGNSLEHTQQLIDNLKTALSEKQGYLDFQMPDWVYRRILCTLTNADIINRESYDIEHASYKLTFRAENPFWSEIAWSSSLFEQVNDEINETIYNEWSEYSNPIINIVVYTATSCNEVVITIWENTLTINQTLNIWDVLNINTDEKMITLNDNSIDFSWKFPKLEAWTNTFTLQANWTYLFDVSVLYPKNYL